MLHNTFSNAPLNQTIRELRTTHNNDNLNSLIVSEAEMVVVEDVVLEEAVTTTVA